MEIRDTVSGDVIMEIRDIVRESVTEAWSQGEEAMREIVLMHIDHAFRMFPSEMSIEGLRNLREQIVAIQGTRVKP